MYSCFHQRRLRCSVSAERLPRAVLAEVCFRIYAGALLVGYPCMKWAGGSSADETVTASIEDERSEERDDRERPRRGDVQHRHPCYIDIRPSIIAATAAIVEELDLRLWADDASPANTFSSLRMQFVFAVISAGQTTRWKFALCNISPCSCATKIKMSTLERMHLGTNQTAICSQVSGCRVGFRSHLRN